MVQTNTTLQYKSLAREHKIQQWRQFLCSSINKTSLVNVLVGDGNYSDADICCKALYATYEETCFKMTAD